MLKFLFCDLTHTGLGINNNTFPLGLGTVASYLIKSMNEKLKYEIIKFPENLNDALKREFPDVLCMSYFAFNANLSYEYAKYVKTVSPKTLVVFGGPNFSLEKEKRKTFLKNHPAIDFYIKWDGEYALTDLIQRYINSGLDITNLKSSNFISDNICYTYDDQYLEGDDKRVTDLMNIPSPYLTGLFDNLFQYPLTPTIETNRGCPFSCTFCNDGHSLRNAITSKSVEFVKEELEYIASRTNHPAHYNISIVDLNFGMYKEDLITSKMINSIIKKYDWPNRIEIAMGKSQPRRLVEVANIINEAKPGIMKLAPSFQSTDIEILKNVKRKNISMDQLIKMRDWSQQDTTLEFFTEIILALPGDSLIRHYKTLEDCIDKLLMNSIDIHQLTILKGSEMETTYYRDLYKLNSKFRVYVGCVGIYPIGENKFPCAEIEEVVVSNKTLSFKEYIECRIMNLLVKIYIDHDPFSEILGIIKKSDLSVFEILLLLKNQILSNYSSLTDLINSFIEGSTKPLFDNLKEINDFVFDFDNIKGYESGKYGQNELSTHRAKAYVENLDDLYDALKDATILYLKNKNLISRDLENYFEEAVEIAKARKFNFDNYKDAIEKEISFDFINADKLGFIIDPQNHKIKRKKVKLFYDEKQLIIIKDMIERYGKNTLHEKGKFYQKGNTMLMNRQISYI
jgi:radical SAM superfamily enzyme YgiQ (UPF0313 family)